MIELQDLRGFDEQLIIDTSETRPTYLLVTKNGCHLRVSSSAYQLLRLVRAGMSFDLLAEALSRQGARVVTAAEVEAGYQRIMEQIAQSERASESHQFGFWLRVPCIPEALVVPIARALSLVLHPMIAGSLLIFITVMTGLMLPQLHSLRWSDTSFWTAYLLFFLSLIIHEFGHASACIRYGARPSDIGVGMYLVYPVCYSDVTAAWQLKRWQRVVVDGSGIFFQMIAGAAYVAGYMYSQWEPFHLAFVLILGSCLFSLNPILKFDGYWMIADALGVTNLGQQPGRILRYAMARLRGHPVKPLPWTSRVIWIVTAYSLLSMGFWGYFLYLAFPRLWTSLVQYPALLKSLIMSVIYPPHMVPLGNILAFLFASLMLITLLLMLSRLIRSFLGFARAFVLSKQSR